jgi:hypothetical protein
MTTYYKSIGLACGIIACAPTPKQRVNNRSPFPPNTLSRAVEAPNTLSSAEQRAGWRLLFDGN